MKQHQRLGEFKIHPVRARALSGRSDTPSVRYTTQSVKFRIVFLRSGIAAAGDSFKAEAVQNSQIAAVVIDQATALQGHGGFGDAGAAHAQHTCKKLMGNIKTIAVCTVLAHQQPARHAWADQVVVQASDRARLLLEEHMEVTVQAVLQCSAERQLSAKRRDADTPWRGF